MPAGLRTSNLMGGPGFMTTLRGFAPTACFLDDDLQVTIKCYAPQAGGGIVGSSILYPVTSPRGIQRYKISGVTRDSNGNPLGNCTVDLFQTIDDVKYATMVSDGSGNFSFFTQGIYQYYAVAYLPGSPDVAGTTVNTLTAVPA